MQVILGGGGAIGVELAKELKYFSKRIRIVGRDPQKVNDSDELFVADLTQKEEVAKAIENCDVAYLTVGLPYKVKVWQLQWPVIMKNTIDACKKNNTRLVFFDNIYMYNPKTLDLITEDSEVLPSSKKGKVRAEIAQMIFDEIKSGNLEALIARSADFYGPKINSSVLIETVFKNLKAGKKANWFCSNQQLHNYTFTPDAAKATALLGNSDKAYGQVWHLPTAPGLTGEKWIELFAKQMNVQAKTMVVPKIMIQILGLFNPIMKEFVEMLYQYDRDYNFSSKKFEAEFNIKPTPVDEAIKSIVEAG
jgi:nucleoside-diphosphate-sugar epimerase